MCGVCVCVRVCVCVCVCVGVCVGVCVCVCVCVCVYVLQNGYVLQIMLWGVTPTGKHQFSTLHSTISR